MNDKLSFLDADTADTKVEEVVEQAATEAVVDAAAVVEEPKPAPVKEQTREDHNPLLPKYLDTHNQLRETQRQLREMQEKQQESAKKMPDPLLEPEEYAAEQQRVMDEKLWDVTARTSEIAANRYYGSAVVKEAFEAVMAQNDPLLGMRIKRSPDPWATIVEWHQREKLLADVGNDPNEWAVRNGYVKPAPAALAGEQPQVQTQPAKTQIPPASLTRAPASKKASDVPTGPGNAFDGVFAR